MPKDLLSYVLGAVPAINSLFVDSARTYPVTEDLWFKRVLDIDNPAPPPPTISTG